MAEFPVEKLGSTMVLSARGLFKKYRQGETYLPVLKGIDIDLRAGERVAIVGASGSGKSTLLHLLAGLDRVDEGEIRIEGVLLETLDRTALARLRNQHIGFVYQFHHLLMEFNAFENVAMPLLIAGHDRRAAGDRAKELLLRVGLERRLYARPAELSGGERARVAIARALAMRPALVLADEPTGNLDERSGELVYDLMLELNKESGTALLMATHDRALSQRMDRSYRLEHGVLTPE